MRVLLSLLIGAIPAMFVALHRFGGEWAENLIPFMAAGVCAMVIVALYRMWYAPLRGEA